LLYTLHLQGVYYNQQQQCATIIYFRNYKTLSILEL
jgi:hypothetical protein